MKQKTVDFIHKEYGVVKRALVSEFTDPLPPEYRLVTPSKMQLRFEEALSGTPIEMRKAVFRLYRNGSGEYAYFFDRVEK